MEKRTPEEHLLSRFTEENPLATSDLGSLVGTFLGSQKKIGIRQFADRTKIDRKRLTAIIDGSPPTDEEEVRIRELFSKISARYDMKNAKTEALKRVMAPYFSPA